MIDDQPTFCRIAGVQDIGVFEAQMTYRLKVAAVAAAIAGSPWQVLAQPVASPLEYGVAIPLVRGPVREAPIVQGPLAVGRPRFGAGTGGITPGSGSGVGGIIGTPRAGTGGVQDTGSLGANTGGIAGAGLAGTGGISDLGSLGRITGGISGSQEAGTGGIVDLDSLGSGTGGMVE